MGDGGSGGITEKVGSLSLIHSHGLSDEILNRQRGDLQEEVQTLGGDGALTNTNTNTATTGSTIGSEL